MEKVNGRGIALSQPLLDERQHSNVLITEGLDVWKLWIIKSTHSWYEHRLEIKMLIGNISNCHDQRICKTTQAFLEAFLLLVLELEIT